MLLALYLHYGSYNSLVPDRSRLDSGPYTTQRSYAEADTSQTNGMRYRVGPQQHLCLLAVYPNLLDQSHCNAGLALIES